MKRRYAVFLILAVSCVLAIAVATSIAIRNLSRQPTPANPAAQATPRDTPPSAPAAQQPQTGISDKRPIRGSSRGGSVGGQNRTSRPTHPERPSAFLYFRANALGENYGKLAIAKIDAIDSIQYSTELKCSRVHFAGGAGVCLSLEKVGPNYAISYATGFDAAMKRGWTTRVMGVPSRVRVSPSGRLAAVTTFRFGESYASLNFSTQTTILDAGSGDALADLEQFSVTRNGEEFKSPDFNFWGVTFTKDENIFYATLWSKTRTYLVKGDLAKRSAMVIHDSVECPSLSPDGTRIAFKKRTEGKDIAWRLTVLDLRSGVESPLDERRSVDDQVEWLDNNHLLYALSPGNPVFGAIADIWVLPTSTAVSPQLFLKGGFSPAVFRSQNLASSSGMSRPLDRTTSIPHIAKVR